VIETENLDCYITTRKGHNEKSFNILFVNDIIVIFIADLDKWQNNFNLISYCTTFIYNYKENVSC
jgi:hypothetical protein